MLQWHSAIFSTFIKLPVVKRGSIYKTRLRSLDHMGKSRGGGGGGGARENHHKLPYISLETLVWTPIEYQSDPSGQMHSMTKKKKKIPPDVLFWIRAWTRCLDKVIFRNSSPWHTNSEQSGNNAMCVGDRLE